MSEPIYETIQDHPHIKLGKLLRKDTDLAWVWHCNIAQAIMGNGTMKWKESNEAACRVMKLVFGADTSEPFRKLISERVPAGTKLAVNVDGSKT